MGLDVRVIDDSELAGWLRTLQSAFLRPPSVSPEEVEVRRQQFNLDRVQGAFDGGQCVGAFRSFAQELTTVGGAALPSCAITNVAVLGTHRRRGLLSRMMANELAIAKERGDAVASLISAEYPIYGRYGFGPATWTAEWRVEGARSQLDPHWSGPEDGGSVELVDSEGFGTVGPPLHDRFRAQQPGAVSRSDHWWKVATGAVRVPSMPWSDPFHVVYRDAVGEVQGLAVYGVDGAWEAKQPEGTVNVHHLLATTPAAERALWHYLLSIDWTTSVTSGHRAPDDLLPLYLGDPRAARLTTLADFLWLRPLDVARMLTARTYSASGSLVLQLRDAAGLADGRFLLDVTPDGAQCTPTTQSPDLTMDVGELAALYLGDQSAIRMAALGWIDEERTGALARADALLRNGRRPWCPDVF